jgi:hypothetical protein
MPGDDIDASHTSKKMARATEGRIQEKLDLGID